MEPPLTQIEKMLSFYAGMLRNWETVMRPAVLQKWRPALPQWINTQYAKLDKGGLPTNHRERFRKRMGDCISCVGRIISPEGTKDPNPFMIAKQEREGAILFYEILGPHEGLSRPRRD